MGVVVGRSVDLMVVGTLVRIVATVADNTKNCLGSDTSTNQNKLIAQYSHTRIAYNKKKWAVDTYVHD